MASPPPPPPLFNPIATTIPNNNNIAHSSPSSSSSSPLSNLSPSIIIIILILSITIFITASLCLILRLLHRRHSVTAATTATTTTSTRRVSPETPNPSFTSSLPLFTFSSVTRRSSSTAASDCAVCLSKFEPHDQLRLLPLCCHAFHAHCIDTWLQSNDTCPLCRSPIQVSESDVIKALLASSANSGDSFRLEIGSVSRRLQPPQDSVPGESRRSYSIGSFDYVVEEESEITFGPGQRRAASESKDEVVGAPVSHPMPEPGLADEVAAGRSWLKEYMDRLSVSLSSRTLSFRGSGRFFTGSSRRSEVAGVGECDLEANRVGEEISELFRWISGV